MVRFKVKSIASTDASLAICGRETGMGMGIMKRHVMMTLERVKFSLVFQD